MGCVTTEAQIESVTVSCMRALRVTSARRAHTPSAQRRARCGREAANATLEIRPWVTMWVRPRRRGCGPRRAQTCDSILRWTAASRAAPALSLKDEVAISILRLESAISVSRSLSREDEVAISVSRSLSPSRERSASETLTRPLRVVLRVALEVLSQRGPLLLAIPVQLVVHVCEHVDRRRAWRLARDVERCDGVAPRLGP